MLKWGAVEPGVLPAWVAEMDYALAEPVTAALRAAVDRGEVGYPASVRAGGDRARPTPPSRCATSATACRRTGCSRPRT